MARLRLGDITEMAFNFLPETFTLAELQKVHEFIEERALLGPNFRRKMKTRIEALGLPGRNSHDALDDTLACGELFFDLIRRVPISPDDYIYEPVFD